MSEVSCRVFEFFEVHAGTYGYDLADLVQPTGMPLQVFQDRSQWVSWDDWVTLCEQFEQLVGGPEETIRAGASIIDLEMSGPVRTLAKALVGPVQIYRSIVQWMSPFLFRALQWQVRVVGPDHVVITVTVPEGRPVSPAWFRMAEGAFARTSVVAGTGESRVVATVDGRRGVFDVHCPPAQTLARRLSNRLQVAVSPQVLLDSLVEMQMSLHDAYQATAKASQDRLRVLAALPDPVAVVGADGPDWVNAAWRKQYGETLPEPIARAAGPRLADQHTVEVELEDPTHGTRVIAVPPPVTVSVDGRPSRVIVARDITDRRRARERARIEERLATLGTIAASVGHEINNPLTYARMGVELLLAGLADGASTEALTERAHQVLDGLERVGTITRDLQLTSRDSNQAERVRIAELVASALRLSGSEVRHAAEVQVHLPDDLPPVWAAPSRLVQVLLNLLQNAVHAMAPLAGPHTITITATRSGDHVLLDVDDTGPGVPETLRERVREPFFTTKGQAGSGLGLAICQRILDDHGARLLIDDAPGGGARMRLELPIAHAEQGSERPEASMPSRSLNILVIDDEVAIVDVIRRGLRHHQVASATTAQEAHAILAGNTQWDVVLIDVMLRGTDGPTLRALLPAALQDRVIFITGGVFNDDLRERVHAGTTPVVSKPFGLTDLYRAIARVVPEVDAPSA